MIAKDKHTMLSFIGAVLSVLALISFVILWKTTPYEASEMPIPVIAVTAASVVAFALAGFKNLFLQEKTPDQAVGQEDDR